MREREPARIRDGHYYDVQNGGWYSSFLMQEVFSIFGLTFKSLHILSKFHPIRRNINPAPCIIIVTHLGQPGTEHYFALRRFFEGGCLWNLDSFLDEPKRESNDFVENLIKISGYTAIVISIPENHYFARECNLKFNHQNKRLDLQSESWPFQLELQQPTQVATQIVFDPVSQTDIIIEDQSNLEIDLEIQAHLQNYQIGYSENFIQLMNGDQTLYNASFQELLESNQLQVVNVPSDGHCFISTIIKFFDIFSQQKYTIQQIEQKYLELQRDDETNIQIFEFYRAMLIGTQPPTTSNSLQIQHSDEVINNYLSFDFNRYFRDKEYVDNIYLELIIQFAYKVFNIDILILQRNHVTQYSLLRYLLNEPLHGTSFITLFRTERNDNSHYQLLIPSSYDLNSTTRDNMIRHLIDIKTDEYVDMKCDSDTQSLASNESISHESNSSFGSNSSINSSASSTNSQKKFKSRSYFKGPQKSTCAKSTINYVLVRFSKV